MFKVRQASWRGGAGVCTGNKDTEVLVTGWRNQEGWRETYLESQSKVLLRGRWVVGMGCFEAMTMIRCILSEIWKKFVPIRHPQFARKCPPSFYFPVIF